MIQNQNTIKVLGLIIVLVLGIILGNNLNYNKSTDANQQSGAVLRSDIREYADTGISSEIVSANNSAGKQKISCSVNGVVVYTVTIEITGNVFSGYTYTVIEQTGSPQVGMACVSVE